MNRRVFMPSEPDVTSLTRFFASINASKGPLGAKKRSGIRHADVFVILDEIQMIGLQAESDSSICLAVASFVRPSNLVIRKTVADIRPAGPLPSRLRCRHRDSPSSYPRT